MKYHFTILFLLAAMLLADTNAIAQSRRERKERERREREREEYFRRHPDRRPDTPSPREESRPEAPRPKPKKRLEVDYPASVKREVYRIDVLIPLYLDELVKNGKPVYKGKMPDKAVPGMEFYQGVKLAADTLEFKGYKLDIYVHDITDPKQSAKALINEGKLKSTDLIIGAVQSGDIPELAAFAKRNDINFISAFSPADAGVTNNPWFTLVQPRLQTHCEKIMKKVAEKYHKEQITICYRNSVNSDENAYGYLTNILEENDLRKLNCNTAPDSAALAKIFTKEEVNVIIMPIVEVAYAESLLKRLYKFFPDLKFAVYGMPSWKNMTALRKPDAFPNVAVYYTTPFYYETSTNNSQLLAMIYQSKFNGRPGEMTYRGYELVYWYATLLREYGTVFNPYIKNNDNAPFTRFEIKTEWDKRKEEVLYNENQYLYMYRYQSSSYMIEK
ncbi:MAG: amino acid ABC transporter substrate-binding protein [Flavipsychrobacter sp.]|nr:amino acid ABC transporter substrate-binding protein [Flavipsychrobacter sp.]